MDTAQPPADPAGGNGRPPEAKVAIITGASRGIGAAAMFCYLAAVCSLR